MKSTQLTRERRGKPSHRADLRQELLEAARAFVVREGYETLSIRKLAEEIGVSSAAPYHHFPDRRSLLIALALDSYREMFSRSLEDVVDDGPRSILKGLLLNFMRYAAEQPRLFTLMYESDLIRGALDPEIQQAQDQGFRRLQDVMACLAPELSERERSIRMSTIWCAVFGFALQSNHQMIRTPRPEPKPNELAEAIIDQALRLIEP